jgi:hypothetical protein
MVTLLRCAGVEPLLLKGLSSVRLYAEPGLRPCGDIDLCVAPEQFDVAVSALNAAGERCAPVDLHQGVADLEDRSWEEVWCRARLEGIGAGRVRVLGREDQLRHLCLHLLRHGAWRPLWLCDIAAALESLPADFDWNYCLGGKRRLTEWVLCALGLACRLLGARFDPPVLAEKALNLSRRTAALVLHQWDLGVVSDSHSGCTLPFAASLAHPADWLQALRRRWPNPIEAAFKMQARPQSWMPPLFFQFGSFVGRSIRFLGRASSGARQETATIPRPFEIHVA